MKYNSNFYGNFLGDFSILFLDKVMFSVFLSANLTKNSYNKYYISWSPRQSSSNPIFVIKFLTNFSYDLYV